jgi:hypothetical protein
MPVRLRTFLALFFALVAGFTRGAEKWSQLKLGMTPKETLAMLGRPVLQTYGRGFEVWIYDNGAEALLFGSLIGWTAPPSPVMVPVAAVRSVDIWQENRDKAYCPTFLTRLPRPVGRRGIPLRGDGLRGSNSEVGYWAPFYLARQ